MNNGIAVIDQPHRVLDDGLFFRLGCGGRKPALKLALAVSGLIVCLLDHEVFDALMAPDFLAVLVFGMVHPVGGVPWLNVEDWPQVFRQSFSDVRSIVVRHI